MATAIGLFDRPPDAERAIDLLMSRGYGKDDLGVVARDDAVQAYLKEQTVALPATDAGADIAGGALLGGLGGLVAGMAALLIPGLGPVLAAGSLASSLFGLPALAAGAGAALGGLAGALTAAEVPHEEAEVYAEGVKRGGVLVAVRTSEGRLAEAQEIMRSANAIDVDMRRDEWRRAGWTTFNEPPASRPHTDVDQLAQPRAPERPSSDPLLDLEVDKGGT